MAQRTNLHDRVFKQVFDRPDAAADFLAHYLPAEITGVMNLGDVEVVKGTFVDRDLKEHLSDLLYRVGLKGEGKALVYVLFEHKSRPDKRVAFQMLRYMVKIWETVSAERKGKLPPIFPLVLYHGPVKWSVSKAFSSVIDWRGAQELKRYVPGFEYYLFDLSLLSAADTRGAATLRTELLALKYVLRPDLREKLPEILGVWAAC